MPDFLKISDTSYRRRFVVSDIHGCLKTFNRLLLKVLKLEKSDQLFLLGDYIDRGPHTKGVLDRIIRMIEVGYTVYPLRGNHEDDLLSLAKEESRFLIWHIAKNRYLDMLIDDRLNERYHSFLSSLPYYYELDRYYLVHAGFNFDVENPFEDKVSMLWIRYFDPPADALKGKQVVHGHDPVYLKMIREHIDHKRPSLPLDNGIFLVQKHKLYDHTQMGHLCAMDLDTQELFVQRNIDMV